MTGQGWVVHSMSLENTAGRDGQLQLREPFPYYLVRILGVAQCVLYPPESLLCDTAMARKTEFSWRSCLA